MGSQSLAAPARRLLQDHLRRALLPALSNRTGRRHCWRSITWPRGRIVGGSSSINGLLYIRGQREDYDDWAKKGATGWDYRSVLPYFKRSERYEGGESEFHGAGGELGVSELRNDHPVAALGWARPGNTDFPTIPT